MEHLLFTLFNFQEDDDDDDDDFMAKDGVTWDVWNGVWKYSVIGKSRIWWLPTYTFHWEKNI